jgi:magnesium-transporting ATPase (P-type)
VVSLAPFPQRAPVEHRVGLSAAEARRLLELHGPNVLAEARPPSRVRRLFAQLVHLFALLLWAGAALALLGRMPELSIAIVVVVLVNAVFAFVQEDRAERAAEALREMLPRTAHVRRAGELTEISAEEIVPGDVLVLQSGDRISADGDVLVDSELRVDNSTLTGEAWPVRPEGVVFAGTFVSAGAGEAVVTATGMSTRFGKIAALTQKMPRERSPLERELEHVTRLVAVLCVGVGFLFFLAAGALGMGVRERFVLAIGVMVANVPEGLLPTVTLSLALASQRMARRSALVRRLSAVETLGETTVICTDKTGTLTENELTVVRVWTPGVEFEVEGAGYEPFGRFRRGGEVVHAAAASELLRAGMLCNDSRLASTPSGWAVTGDATEGALVVVAEKGGLRHEHEVAQRPRILELPFDSRRRRMTTVHLEGTERVAYVKGAPEEVLRLSLLSADERAAAAEAAERMAGSALRVLALARRTLPDGCPATIDATASTTHRRCARRTSASRWGGAARTSRRRPPT